VNLAKPARLPSACAEQSYFVTTSADQKRFLFQSESMANLFIETLYSYRRQKKFLLHEFVLMPNHLHVILTPTGITLERAMQFMKGGYSHRLNSELGKKFEVWQRGFTDRRIRNRSEYDGFREYIHMNPVEGGLVSRPEEFRYSSAHRGFKLDPPPAYLSG
jgi:putative transposase